MQLKVDRGAEILMKHQLFLENIDRRERETNLVVLGVPEDGELVDGADNDDGKLCKIWDKFNEPGSRISHRRLGKTVQPNKKRPILVRVESKDLRDNVLEKAKVLKEATTEYKTIYIKKDVHPAVRKEWNRLKEAETNEKPSLRMRVPSFALIPKRESYTEMMLSLIPGPLILSK